MNRPLIVLVALLLASGIAIARRPRSPQVAAPEFDHFVLALSWVPSFCAQGGTASSGYPECRAGKRVGFTVRGFWPQTASGKTLESCGKAKDVPRAVVRIALPDMLREGLIRDEWAAHGTCSGLNAFDYFSDLVQARSSIQIPVQITSIDDQIPRKPDWVEQQFAMANPDFPSNVFQTSCGRGGNIDEVRVCFDKGLKPRQCPTSVARCDVPTITIPPPL